MSEWEGTPCTVCGQPAMYGSRHPECASFALSATGRNDGLDGSECDYQAMWRQEADECARLRTEVGRLRDLLQQTQEHADVIARAGRALLDLATARRGR